VFIPKREFDKITQLEASEREIEGMKRSPSHRNQVSTERKILLGFLLPYYNPLVCLLNSGCDQMIKIILERNNILMDLMRLKLTFLSL
jgi:hypothetical protein